MAEIVYFYKGEESGIPTTGIEPGALYHCTDTGNTYRGISSTQMVLFSTTGGKSPTGEGGVSFGNSQATGEGSIAVGESTLAAGESSFAQGDTIWRSGATNVKTEDGKYYVNNTECDMVQLVGIDECEPISKEDLEALVLEEVVLLTDGSYVLLSDRRYTEAYGTGSASMGQGSVAYSRSSKSLGYRTQAGAPSTPELRAKRPEVIMPVFDFFAYKDSFAEFANIDAPNNQIIFYNGIGTVNLYYKSPGAGGLILLSFDSSLENIYCEYNYIGNFSSNTDESIKQIAEIDKNTKKIKIPVDRYAKEIRIDLTTKDLTSEVYYLKVNTDETLYYPAENVGQNAVAFGADTAAIANQSMAIGFLTKAIGNGTLAEGQSTVAQGAYSHAEGLRSKTQGGYSHAEGIDTSAIGQGSHAEGNATKAIGINSHTEGISTEATGGAAHAEGNQTKAIGNRSHAEGLKSTSYGESSHAEGQSTNVYDSITHGTDINKIRNAWNNTKFSVAYGGASHSEGLDTIAFGNYSHAEGWQTKAISNNSHSEGVNTEASGNFGAHAEGNKSEAIGDGSHAEGYAVQAKGKYSHAEGNNTISAANKNGSTSVFPQHVQGQYNIEDTNNDYAHIVGWGTPTARKNIHTIKTNGDAYFAGGIEADGSSLKLSEGEIKITDNGTFQFNKTISFAPGGFGINTADGFVQAKKGNFAKELTLNSENVLTESSYITAGKKSNTTLGQRATAEGHYTTASGSYSHAEGYYTTASGSYSHAESYSTTASGTNSHAEGYGTTASGYCSHTEGYATKAIGDDSHAEGYFTTASGTYGSHAEGETTIASGQKSHAEGESCISSGMAAHSEGRKTIAAAYGAHAEGFLSRAGYLANENSEGIIKGRYSHAEGEGTIATGQAQHVEGKYNIEDSSPTDGQRQGTYAHIIGNGTSESNRSNAFAIKWNGAMVLANGAYGEELPDDTDAVEGQLFFLFAE